MKLKRFEDNSFDVVLAERFSLDGSILVSKAVNKSVKLINLNVSDSSAVIRTYSGYTEFYGIAKNDRGFIISLGKGAVE